QGWAVQKLSHEGANTPATCNLTCDFTITPGPPGPPEPCATAQDGYYCGQSPQWTGGDKDYLYHCKNGVTGSKEECLGGCEIAPPGMPDRCLPYDGGVPDAGPTPDDGGPSPMDDAGSPDAGATPGSEEGACRCALDGPGSGISLAWISPMALAAV